MPLARATPHACPTARAPRRLGALPAALLALGALAGCASRGPSASVPRLEGSYVLAWRELPDGRIARPPEVLGAMDVSPTHRNLNVSWMQDGRRHAVGLVAAWQERDGVLTETSVYRMADLPGKGLAYRTEPVTGSAPVRREPGVLRVQLPLDGEPELEVRADGLTSRKPGAFVDHWRRTR